MSKKIDVFSREKRFLLSRRNKDTNSFVNKYLQENFAPNVRLGLKKKYSLIKYY
jgi:hypothetical protein